MMSFIDVTETHSAVDLGELLLRLDGDHRLLKELVSIFATQTPRLLTQIKIALERGEMDEVKLRAHTMTGMFSTLACVEAKAMAMQMERMAGQHKVEGMQNEVVKLEREVRRAFAALQSACTEIV